MSVVDWLRESVQGEVVNHFATRPKGVLLFTQSTFEGGDIEVVGMVQRETGVASGEIEEIDSG